MKPGIWIAIAVGIVLILVGVIVILIFVPLGPALSLNRPNPSLTPEVVLVPVPTNTPLADVTEIVPNLTPADTTPSEGKCGSGSMTFLALGESLPPRGTDAIRLVKVNFDLVRIDVLALPSELWVNTPGLNANGIGGATLNDVYLQGKSLATGDERARMLAAANLFASTLQADFGYAPDHYFVLKEPPFSEYVDKLGGLDVTLPRVVDGGGAGHLGYFPAGAQHLSGPQALDLVRIDTNGEWVRFDNQWLVIQAIYQSVLAPKNWDQLPALVQDFHDNVITDFSVSQALQAACILKQPGVVVNQEEVGPALIYLSGTTMLPRQELGSYILQTVGK